MVDLGYQKHFRVQHGNNEFANKHSHITGIESFWAFAKTRIVRFRGLAKLIFYFHLKEYEFRFNHTIYPSGIISEAIFYSIQLVTKRLRITTKLRLSSSLDKDESLKGQAKVIHILQMLHATTYINAIGGVELYDKKLSPIMVLPYIF